MEKELKQTIELFLSTNNISYNKEELHLQLLTHPYFPSINAITDLFDHFKIENVAAELPQEIAILSELPDTFLAHINEKGIENIVFVEKKGEEIKLVYDVKTTKYFSPKEFVNLWTGVIVAVEKNEEKSKKLTKNSSVLKTTVFGITVLLLGLQLVLNPLSILGYSFLLSALIGVGISVLLVQKELGLHSKSLDKFCEASVNNSCDDVLNSKGAMIFGVFKLSDIGIVYFSGITFSILLSSFFSITSYTNIIGLSLVSALFIPYSIYYQWKVIKKWCPLCLMVLGVLLLQAVISITFFNLEFVFILNEWIIVLFSFLFLGLIWSELKSGYKKKQELYVLQLEHYKFKRNSGLFITALKATGKKEMNIVGANEIVFGNKNASLQIVLVTNPSCFFCKEAHQVFHNVLKNRAENLQLIIRFNVNTKNPESNISLEISNQLIEVYKTKGPVEALLAMDEIYSEMKPETWLQKWKSTTFLTHITDINKANEWCVSNAVNFTPAVFINGYLFPREYHKKDITFFIDDLIEEAL